MLRILIRRYGAKAITLGATLLAVIFSVTITIVIHAAFGFKVSFLEYMIAILSPGIILPLFGYQMIHLLAQLDGTERRLRSISTTDELTGAYNRRFVLELAHRELERAKRDGGMFSIAILDFDNFKLINDHFGHLAGDQALREVSRVCQSNMREADIFARYGGDEFIFLFPQTSHEDAVICLDRIMEQISALSFESQGKIVSPRVSIGVHPYSPKSDTLDAILEKADLALYKAKQTGGSRVAH